MYKGDTHIIYVHIFISATTIKVRPILYMYLLFYIINAFYNVHELLQFTLDK